MRRILYLICVAPHYKIYCDIGKTLCYHKKAFIRNLICVCSVVSENEFISDFIVIFNSMFVLLGVISINLRLFFLTC